MHIFTTANSKAFPLPYINRYKNNYYIAYEYYGTHQNYRKTLVAFKINTKSLAFLKDKEITLEHNPYKDLNLDKIYHATEISRYLDCYTSLDPALIANMTPIEVPGVYDFSLFHAHDTHQFAPIEHDFDLSNLPSSGTFTILKPPKSDKDFGVIISKRSAKASFSPGTFVLVKRKMKVFMHTGDWQLIDYLYLGCLKKCKNYYEKIIHYNLWIPSALEQNSPLSFRNPKGDDVNYTWNREIWKNLQKQSLKPLVVPDMKESVKAALSYFQQPSSIRVQRLRERLKQTDTQLNELTLSLNKDEETKSKETEALLKVKNNLASAIAALEEKEIDISVDENYINSLKELGVYISNLKYVNPDSGFQYTIDSFENKEDIKDIITRLKLASFDIDLCLPYKVHLGIPKPIAIGPLKASYKCSMSSYGTPKLSIEKIDALSCLGINISNQQISAIPHSTPESYTWALETHSRYVCMGELIGTAVMAEGTNDLRMLLMSILTFFASANKTDAWGRNYKYFPNWGVKTNPISSKPKKQYKLEKKTNYVFVIKHNGIHSKSTENTIPYISAIVDSDGKYNYYLCLGKQQGNLIYRTRLLYPISTDTDALLLRAEGFVFAMNIMLTEVTK